MANEKPLYFDLDTVALLRATLDDAWACIAAESLSRAAIASWN